jgi:hypothetical protein
MVHKLTVFYRVRIAKIHSHSNAGILERLAIVIRDVDGIAKKRLVYRPSEVIEQHEVQLMDMKGVQLVGSVLDNPVLYGSLLGDDVRTRSTGDRKAPAFGPRR